MFKTLRYLAKPLFYLLESNYTYAYMFIYMIEIIVFILRSVSHTLVYRGCINLLEQPLTFQLIIIGIVRRYKTLFLLQGITQESVHSWVYTNTLHDTWVHVLRITWYMNMFTYTYLLHGHTYMNTIQEHFYIGALSCIHLPGYLYLGLRGWFISTYCVNYLSYPSSMG